jgi:hypothetical protein
MIKNKRSFVMVIIAIAVIIGGMAVVATSVCQMATIAA